ncbi:hypothetical protein PDE_06647 [Penicillium oxalicum 114-2]|uniref:TLDc domain-containing protein n=1 Tax=Penicillium oxalicum (strain 114-2 / CGMCC 5302) TaxID=933388 RepID=S7ZLZ9_PENO1|nr:hypothetical protein PDE_06647 [Penicillium oxalicum 114-2]
MASTFPHELSTCVTDAAPILHRSLLRLGSYPYQNDPVNLLTLEVLRTAVIILLGLDNWRILETDSVARQSLPNDRSVSFQRRLFFQSIAEQKETPRLSRGVGDDCDLQKALDLITQGNFKRDKRFPTRVILGPQYPPAEHFPSSFSTLTSGLISREDLRPLLRLMLVTQLHLAGIDPECFASSLAEIEASTDSLLALFLSGDDSSANVTFSAFEKAIGDSLPNLFQGIPRVLGPLNLARELPSQHPLTSITQAQGLLKEMFKPAIRTPIPPRGLISTLTRLSQLSLSLPQDFPIEAPTIIHSSSRADLDRVRDCLSDNKNSQILLVSGRGNKDTVVFAVYFRTSSSAEKQIRPSMIVQLTPVQKAFRGSEEQGTEEMNDFPSKPTDQDGSHLILALSECILVVKDSSAEASLLVRTDDGIDRPYILDAVEILSFEGTMVCDETFGKWMDI